MDQQSYFYGKHNLGSLNYQTAYGTTDSEYQSTAYNDHSAQSLHSTTGLNFNSSLLGAAGNYVNDDATNLTAVGSSSRPTNNTNTNNSNTINNNINSNLSTNLSTDDDNRIYSYISDANSHAIQNVPNAPTNLSQCNDLAYGGVGTFNSNNNKSYENTATGTAQVPSIAVTSNSLQSSSYHSNLNYGPVQNVDYSLHKSAIQNYTPNVVIQGQNHRNVLNTPIAFSTNDPHAQTVSNKSRSATESKIQTTKTSVIKPINSYSAPLNFTRQYQTYPVVYPNAKASINYDKNTSTTSGRNVYATNNATNHKSGEVYYPEPISARFSGYPINVCASATGHTSSAYLANSYLGYGHHLTQPQGTIHHGRGLLPTGGYSDSIPSEYYRQHGIVVRPTPNTYKQTQHPYQSAYSYARGDSSGTVSGDSNSNLSKAQQQKTTDDSISSIASPYNESTFDRRHLRYSAMYGTNYIDTADYQPYTNFSNLNSSSFYPPPKASSKVLYNYNAGLNVYGNPNAQLMSQGPSTTVASSTSIPSTTTTTTTIVQQPVAINPNPSQLISSNYDASALHAHSMIAPPLFNSNTSNHSNGNSNKDYCPTNQYQQNSYAHSIFHSPTDGYNFLPATNYSNYGPYADKTYADKFLATSSSKKSNGIDLEDQINSSRILKSSKTLTACPKVSFNGVSDELSTNATNDLYNVQFKRHHTMASGGSNNKNQYAYNFNAHNNSYEQQQIHQTSQSLWRKPVSMNSQQTSSSTPHMHPKKQSIRDYLQTWNEFDDESETAVQNKADKNAGSSRVPTNKGHIFTSNANNQSPAGIVQPIQQVIQPTSHLKSALTLPSTYHHHPSHHHHDDGRATAMGQNMSKIHVGITVDNGSENLPDIIVDVAKPKMAGEWECVERTNVILTPKHSEKLYILDSIDVPLSDLNKYRHLNVVNKLPDNIVMPAAHHQMIKHDQTGTAPSGDNSLKFFDDVDGNKISRNDDADFEKNAPDDNELHECINDPVIQRVKKIIKKYRRQREYRRKMKSAQNSQKTKNLSVPKETNSNLSTPLKSLSPAHGLNCTDDMLLSGTCPVDLSMNNKSVDEFIESLSICSDDSNDFNFEEIIFANSTPPVNCQDNIDVVNTQPEDPAIITTNGSMLLDVNNDRNEMKSPNTPATIEIDKDDNHPAEIEMDSVEPFHIQRVESLKVLCMKTVNSEEFRGFFIETIIKPAKNDTNLISPKHFESDFLNTKNKTFEIESSPSSPSSPSSSNGSVQYIRSSRIITRNSMNEDSNSNSSSNDVIFIEETQRFSVQRLQTLAANAVRLNQMYLSANSKASKIGFDFELQQQKSLETDLWLDTNVNRVKSLRELALEVANTIYSFGVRPLQDICRMAIDRYSHMYMQRRFVTTNHNMIEDARIGEVNSVNGESMFNSRPTEVITDTVTETPFRLSEPMVIEEPMVMDDEEKSHESHEPPPPVECDIDVEKLDDDDDSPVKSLKILAQICVDELREMQMKKELNKKTETEINVSSESDSDEISTETESKNTLKDVETTKQNEKCESSDSDSSTDHEDSDSSTSESDSSSDDDESIMDKQDIVIPEPEPIPSDPPIVKQPNEFDDQPQTENTVINEIIEPKSPATLKELCKAVLDAHSMELRYEVASLKYLCEHSMSMYGMEIPTILFVNEDGVSAIETSETYDENEMENDNVYLRVEFDETELANLLNAAEEPSCELSEYEGTISNDNVTDNVSLIEQCVALENILSSPPYEQKVSNDGSTENAQNCDYVYFEEENDNHHMIQYEETVSQADDNNIARMSVAAAKLKKQLQSKYVQSSRYYQMFIVNHILKKYFKFVETTSAKKHTVRKRLNRTIRILDEKKRKREEEERRKAIKPQPIMARRRSARLLQKRRFSYCEERALESMWASANASRENEKVSKETEKPKEKNKNVEVVKQKENSNKQDTSQSIKRKSIENKTNNKMDRKSKGDDKPTKSKKVSDTVEVKKVSSKPTNDSSKANNNNNKNNINNNVCVSELSINNTAPFRDDVLERIAQKRILKRRLSVCERSISRPNDDFCYDEDGQISEMLSSFINNGLEDQRSGPLAKKRFTPIQNNINMNNKNSLTTYSSNMSNAEPKSLSSLLKSLPSIERITFKRDNLSSITPTPKDDVQPKSQVPVVTSQQSPFPFNIVKRVPPPRRKSCSASEWMVERSREYNFSPKNTFNREFNRDRMSPGIERFSRADVQQQINSRSRKNSPVSRLSPPMRPNHDKFSPKINNNITAIPRRSPQRMQPNVRLNAKHAWSPSDRPMQPNPKTNIQREWSPIRSMQINSRANMQRSWSPIRSMQTDSKPNSNRPWSPDRSAQQFNPFRDRNRQMRTVPRAEPPRDRFESYNNRRMTNRGPQRNIPMRNPNPSQFRPNNDRFLLGVAFHTQNVPIKEYTTEKPNQQSNIQPTFQKQVVQPSAENTMHNCDPRLTSRVIHSSPVTQSPLNFGSPVSQSSIHVGLSPISKEPTPNQSPNIELKLPTAEKIPPNQIPNAKKLPSPPKVLFVPTPPKYSPPNALFVPEPPKHSPPKSLFVPNPPKHSTPKPLASKPIVDPNQIYSLLQNCPAIENERKKNISDEKTPTNMGTGPNQSTQRNNTAIIIQNLLQSFAESNRTQNSAKTQEKLPTTDAGPSNSTSAGPHTTEKPEIVMESLNNPSHPEVCLSDKLPMESNHPEIMTRPDQMPEMNTIPLELDHIVNNQRKRLMQRRNSLCVPEINNHQRNILNKFANSIRQKKLNVDDLLKIYAKPKANSSSSESSTNSSSSESESSSSSSSESDAHKSHRHHKKKRSNKRSSDSSSTSSSSSSSSTSDSKRNKRYRKTGKKKSTNNHRKNPVQMFDIETIKQNAFIGFQEEFLRNNRVNQLAFNQTEYHTATPISYTSASPHDSDV